MSVSDREKFCEWYERRKCEQFDLAKGLVEYCKSDVDILRRYCLNFREEFLQITQVDPFQYITIASACMSVYRTQHLDPETVAVVPVHGYVRNITTSKSCIEWLHFMEFQTRDVNQHHGNGTGEVQIEGRFVDGYNAETKTVYQFMGCFFHDCNTCFDEYMIHPLHGKPMWVLTKDAKVQKRQLEAGN